MRGSIYDWSKEAGQNDVADADINWREGMFPSEVNDSARQMMGRNAEFRDDITGALTAGGTANAIILTANSAFSSLTNGRRLVFRAAANNTEPVVTANVNGLGGKPIRAMGPDGDAALSPGDIKKDVPYDMIYSTGANDGGGAWLLFAPYSRPVESFPAGTRLLFQQSAAPTGWTKDASSNVDNKALRLVAGSVTTGGIVDFTTAFSSERATTVVAQSGSVGGTALNSAQMPSHSHSYSGMTGGQSADHQHWATLTGGTDAQGSHAHSTTFGQGGGISTSAGAAVAEPGFGVAENINSNAAGLHAHNVSVSGATGGVNSDHAHGFSGTTSATGGSEAHSHTFTGDGHAHTVDLAVQYVDVIVCQKDA